MMNDVTAIIREIENGNSSKSEELLPLIYNELRRLAKSKLANEAPGQTLQISDCGLGAYRSVSSKQKSSTIINRRGFFGF